MINTTNGEGRHYLDHLAEQGQEHPSDDESARCFFCGERDCAGCEAIYS